MKDLELEAIVKETSDLLHEARAIKAKSSAASKDLRRLAEIRLGLTSLCPPERYAWVDGLPKIDILKELSKINHKITDDQKGLES